MKAKRSQMMLEWQENKMMMTMVMGMSTNLIGFLFRNLKGYRIWIVLAFLLTLVQVSADILVAFPFKFILDKLVSNKNPALPNSILDFFDRLGAPAGISNGESHTLVGVILLSVSLLVLLNVVNALVTYAQNSIASLLGKNLTAWLRRELFAQIQRLTLDWHNKQKKGDIIQRIIGDIAALERLVTDGLIEVLTGILTLVGCIIILLLISVPFTLLFLVVLPALVLIAYSYAKNTRIAIKKAVMAATGGLAGLAISLSGGYAYQQIIFNAHIGGTTGNPGSGTISVVSAEPGGAPNQTFTFPLSGGFGNGENFFTLTASGGEAILSTSFSAPNTVTDVRQVRLTGFTQPGQSDIPGGVPEPASMVLLSSALVGIGLLRKRK